MAKITVLIDVNIGAQVPPGTAWMIWAAPFMFDSGNTVILPVGAPVKLVAGVGEVQVDAGPWMVTAAGPGFTKTQAWMVPESDVPVQFGSLVEITDERLLGYGPTWAARAELAALQAIAYVEDAAGYVADALAYRNQAQTIADAMPTTTDALVTAVFDNTLSAFRLAVEAWANATFQTHEEANQVFEYRLGPPVDYTWDPATGSIATVVEHYPGPLGDQTTTFGGYNAAGDPTSEIDPAGVHWVLAYDSAGNVSSRTVAP